MREPNRVRRLCKVPDDAQVESLVAGLRSAASWAEALDSPESLARDFGMRLRVRPIGRDSSSVQSLLVPLQTGGFSVVLNAHHEPTVAQSLWLVAHEVGHSFFYELGAPPQRIIPGTPAEEQFCDRFADELLRGRFGCAQPAVA